MKKTIKRIFVSAGVVLLLLIAILGLRIYHVVSDMKKMTPLETGEIMSGIYAVKDSYVNFYLIKGTNGFIAIDSGINPVNVPKELTKLKIDPALISAVFLTHGDADHAGGLSIFKNAKIYLASEEEQMVDGRTARFIIIKNKSISKHDLLDDNQTIEIAGLKVHAILTPGHTPGAMCYLIDGQHLFTGDSMRLTDGKVEIFSKAINMDSDTQLVSLKKLAQLKGVKNIFTAHFGFTDNFDRAFEGIRY
jgi:hydroxyacylglutathione hydrolase